MAEKDIIARTMARKAASTAKSSKLTTKNNRKVIAHSIRNGGYHISGTISGQLGGTYSEDFTVDDDASGISLPFANYYGSVIGDNKINVKVGVNIRGVYYPIFFGGKRIAAIEPGGDTESEILGVSVSKNEIIRVQTLVTVDTLGEKWPLGQAVQPFVAGITDYTMTDIPSGTTAVGYGPLMIRGYVKKGTAKPTVSLWGSSSMGGTGDYLNMIGLGQRALIGDLAYYRLAKGGDTIPDITYPRMSLAKYSDVAINFIGSNDIANGATFQTLKDNLVALFTYQRNLGVKVYACTFYHWTDSTDNWATVANQTRSGAPFAVGGVCDQINTWLRTIPDEVDGVFDVVTAVESSPGSGLFKAGISTDGRHVNSIGHALTGAVIRKGIEWFEKDERMTSPVVADAGRGVFATFNVPDRKYSLGATDSGHLWIANTFDGWDIVNGRVKSRATSVDYAIVESNLADCTIECDIIPNGSAKNAGLALRYDKGRNNGYAFKVGNTSGGQFILYKRTGVATAAVVTINTTITTGQRYNCRAVLQGTSIKIYKDSELLIDYTIPEVDQTDAYIKGTLHGFYTVNDQLSEWDNFKVY